MSDELIVLEEGLMRFGMLGKKMPVVILGKQYGDAFKLTVEFETGTPFHAFVMKNMGDKVIKANPELKKAIEAVSQGKTAEMPKAVRMYFNFQKPVVVLKEDGKRVEKPEDMPRFNFDDDIHVSAVFRKIKQKDKVNITPIALKILRVDSTKRELAEKVLQDAAVELMKMS